MGDLFQQGPSSEETASKRRAEFHRRARQIPAQDRTPDALFDLAEGLGAKHPGLLVEDYWKQGKEYRTMLKE